MDWYGIDIQPDVLGYASTSEQSDYLEVQKDMCLAVNRPVLVSDKLNIFNKNKTPLLP